MDDFLKRVCSERNELDARAQSLQIELIQLKEEIERLRYDLKEVTRERDFLKGVDTPPRPE